MAYRRRICIGMALHRLKSIFSKQMDHPESGISSSIFFIVFSFNFDKQRLTRKLKLYAGKYYILYCVNIFLTSIKRWISGWKVCLLLRIRDFFLETVKNYITHEVSSHIIFNNTIIEINGKYYNYF